jgi:hypothetical protein
VIDYLYKKGSLNGALNSNKFAIFMANDLNTDYDSEITFGDINDDRYTGQLHYFDVIDSWEGFWQVKLNDILING